MTRALKQKSRLMVLGVLSLAVILSLVSYQWKSNWVQAQAVCTGLLGGTTATSMTFGNTLEFTVTQDDGGGGQIGNAGTTFTQTIPTRGGFLQVLNSVGSPIGSITVTVDDTVTLSGIGCEEAGTVISGQVWLGWSVTGGGTFAPSISGEDITALPSTSSVAFTATTAGNYTIVLTNKGFDLEGQAETYIPISIGAKATAGGGGGGTSTSTTSTTITSQATTDPSAAAAAVAALATTNASSAQTTLESLATSGNANSISAFDEAMGQLAAGTTGERAVVEGAIGTLGGSTSDTDRTRAQTTIQTLGSSADATTRSTASSAILTLAKGTDTQHGTAQNAVQGLGASTSETARDTASTVLQNLAAGTAGQGEVAQNALLNLANNAATVARTTAVDTLNAITASTDATAQGTAVSTLRALLVTTSGSNQRSAGESVIVTSGIGTSTQQTVVSTAIERMADPTTATGTETAKAAEIISGFVDADAATLGATESANRNSAGTNIFLNVAANKSAGGTLLNSVSSTSTDTAGTLLTRGAKSGTSEADQQANAAKVVDALEGAADAAAGTTGAIDSLVAAITGTTGIANDPVALDNIAEALSATRVGVLTPNCTAAACLAGWIQAAEEEIAQALATRAGLKVAAEPSTITRVGAKLNAGVAGGTTTIQRLSSLPTGIVPPAGKLASGFYEITPVGFTNADLEAAEVTFVVSKSWMESNSVNPLSINFERYDTARAKWVPLEANLQREVGDVVEYVASPAAFSTWAVTGETTLPAPRFREETLTFQEDFDGLGNDKFFIDVTNLTGGLAEYTATLLLDGNVVESQVATLSVGQKQRIAFIEALAPGTYTARVGSQILTATVKAPDIAAGDVALDSRAAGGLVGVGVLIMAAGGYIFLRARRRVTA